MVKPRLAALVSPFLLVGLVSSPAFSHSRGESYSRLRVTDGTVDLSFSMRVEQFLVVGQRLLRVDRSLESQFLDHVLQNYHVRVDGRECVREDGPDSPVNRASGYLRVDRRFRCPPFERLEVEVDVLMDVAPGHLHRVRLRRPDGTLEERLLLSGERVWSVPLLRAEPSGPEPATIKVFPRYLGLGIQHIVLGVDHLAFLLAVLLSTLGLRATLWAITGFTVGHSITLCLAALGYASPQGPRVEALIGYTIALVAAEAVLLRTQRGPSLLVGVALFTLVTLGVEAYHQSLELGIGPGVYTLAGIGLFSGCYVLLQRAMHGEGVAARTALTGLFGLIHGFGFAGSLMEIGLPQQELLIGLLGFNLGVEVGQLALLTLFLGLVALLLRWQPGLRHPLVRDGTAAVLCGLGLFWFVTRAYG